jgi:hypothetical protein
VMRRQASSDRPAHRYYEGNVGKRSGKPPLTNRNGGGDQVIFSLENNDIAQI